MGDKSIRGAAIMVTKGGNLKQNKHYTIATFLREITFMFTFHDNRVFTFTLSVLKGYNVKGSLRK